MNYKSMITHPKLSFDTVTTDAMTWNWSSCHVPAPHSPFLYSILFYSNLVSSIINLQFIIDPLYYRHRTIFHFQLYSILNFPPHPLRWCIIWFTQSSTIKRMQRNIEEDQLVSIKINEFIFKLSSRWADWNSILLKR